MRAVILSVTFALLPSLAQGHAMSWPPALPPSSYEAIVLDLISDQCATQAVADTASYERQQQESHRPLAYPIPTGQNTFVSGTERDYLGYRYTVCLVQYWRDNLSTANR